MKRYILFFLFLVFTHFTFSQNKQVKLLVEKTNNLELDMLDLVEYAQNNITNEKELAYFFYYWIGTNIKYDHKLLQKGLTGKLTNNGFRSSQKASTVFKNKKGVCAGYANLFKWFMLDVGIEVEVIHGHIRDERNHYIELALDDNYRHAWNAIKINKKWLLIDSTWGTSNNSDVSDYYFDINPKRAIITHYPEKSRWQLLDKPLSLSEFNNSKFIKAIWFKAGFSDVPKLKKDNQYYYFVFKANKEWSVDLLFSIDNENFNNIKSIKKIDQAGFTYLRFNKSHIPKKSFFKVNIKEKEYGLTYYNDVVNFKL